MGELSMTNSHKLTILLSIHQISTIFWMYLIKSYNLVMNWKTELAITLSCCWTRSGSWRDSRSRTLSLPFCLPPLTDSPGRKSYAITPNWSENEWNKFRFRSLASQPSGNCMQRLRASRKGPRTRRWAIYIYQIVMNRAMRKFSPESIFFSAQRALSRSFFPFLLI